jgi:hypothetical protein
MLSRMAETLLSGALVGRPKAPREGWLCVEDCDWSVSKEACESKNGSTSLLEADPECPVSGFGVLVETTCCWVGLSVPSSKILSRISSFCFRFWPEGAGTGQNNGQHGAGVTYTQSDGRWTNGSSGPRYDSALF